MGAPSPEVLKARLAGALGSLVWWDTQSMAGLSNGMVFKVPSNLSHPTRKPRRAPETTTERTLSLPGVWHVAVVCRHTQQWAQCFCCVSALRMDPVLIEMLYLAAHKQSGDTFLLMCACSVVFGWSCR